jgi:hypothetical protein
MPFNYSQTQRQALLNALNNGRPQAIGAADLAAQLNYPVGGNQVHLRNLIKECIEVDGDFIGAATGQPAGFYIISTVAELEEYLDSLENRTRSNNERRSALINNWNNNPSIQNTTRQILTIT